MKLEVYRPTNIISKNSQKIMKKLRQKDEFSN